MRLENYQILKYSVKELPGLFESKLIQNSEILPISSNRLISYVNNPRSNEDDPVLYLLLAENAIVGFRTLLPDAVFFNNTKEKFAWFSGNWVSHAYRRMGVSTILMSDVLKDWKGRLMYTNYAPNSKKLYDKSNEFDLLVKKEGIRLYYKFILHKLLVERGAFFKRIKVFLKFADFCLNLLIAPYYLVLQLKTFNSSKVNIGSKLTDDVKRFISGNSNSVFKRGAKELDWILKHPWISTSKELSKPYPFSHKASQFEYLFLSTKDDTEKLNGAAILKIRDGKLAIPYYYSDSQNSDLTKCILTLAIRKKIEMLTCYQSQMLNQFADLKTNSIFKKTMDQKYFIVKSFANHLNLSKQKIFVQDGDGDCFFT